MLMSKMNEPGKLGFGQKAAAAAVSQQFIIINPQKRKSLAQTNFDCQASFAANKTIQIFKKLAETEVNSSLPKCQLPLTKIKQKSMCVNKADILASSLSFFHPFIPSSIIISAQNLHKSCLYEEEQKMFWKKLEKQW